MGTRVKKDRRANQRAALKIVREDNAKKEQAKQKNSLTDKTNRSNVSAKTAIMKQRNKQALANSTAEKRDPVDSTKPKGVDPALEAKAAKEANKARLGQQVKPVGRNALKVGGGLAGLSALGAIAGKAYGDRKEGESGKTTYARAGAMYNGADAEQTRQITEGVQALEDKKNGKSVAKKEATKTAVEKGKAQAPTGARQATPKKAEAPKAAPKDKPSAEYQTFKKDSAEAKDFRSAFAAARKGGASEFTWQGRKYNTKIKK